MSHASLDSRWVDAIHAKLLVRYGSQWLNLWAGVSPELVKADWAKELAPYGPHPGAIKHAFENLPADKPPTVAQFKLLCRNSPRMAPPALPAPVVNPEIVAAVKKAFTPKVTQAKEWAHRLRRREQLLERLTAAQRTMWREALKHEQTETA